MFTIQNYTLTVGALAVGIMLGSGLAVAGSEHHTNQQIEVTR